MLSIIIGGNSRMEINTKEKKKIIFSAIQPSGTITLGNYLGALKNWVNLQDEFDSIFALADLHTITVSQDPKQLKKNTLEAYALLLACGIDLNKSLLFIQSHVSTHSQLAWILNCYTQFGELSRMTQFKDKSAKHADNINVGLFTYPSLMAADILLYQTDVVPVGIDQKQHLELSRNIAQRFNNIYGETFKLPEPYINKAGAKIMSLQDPSKKMSKSDANANAWIGILDKPEVIMKKFKRAVTDSENHVEYKEGKEGICNLMRIYSSITGKNNTEIELEFQGKGYGDFKVAVAEAVIDSISPIQKRFYEFMDDMSYIKSCYQKSAEVAQSISERTLSKVMKKVGFVGSN